MTEIHAFDPDGTPSPGAEAGVSAIMATTLDPQVASYIGRTTGTATTTALDQAYRRGFSVKEWGAQGDGVTDDTLAIQTAVDAVSALGNDAVLYFPEGTFVTSGRITFTCSLDASAATISYTGSGIAVDLGDSRTPGKVLFRKSMRAPRVKLATKTSPGWATGTTGIRLVNLNACDVYLPHVENFAVGVLVYGLSQGTVHCNVNLGAMENNKVNMLFDANSTGWANQNVFIGGKFAHYSAEGSNVPGSRHLQINQPTHDVNANLFLNPSFEGDTPEYHLDLAGTANVILNGRYEVTGGARLRWRAGATQNQVLYGYQSRGIIETWEAGAHPSNNLVTSLGGHYGRGFPDVIEATASSGSAVEAVMAPGSIAAKANPETAYSIRRSPDDTRMKRPTDVAPRLLLDHVNGRMLLGGGTAAPTLGLGVAGSFLRVDSPVQTTAPAAGTAGALPSAPSGYLPVYLDGAVRYIPYY